MRLLSFINACYRFLSEKKVIACMSIPIHTAGEVGAAIRARRRELGWDQATLADKIGASRLWVNQIERGKPGAGVGLVLRTFAALGLTLTLGTPRTAASDAASPAPVESPDILAILAEARRKPSP
jgi:HTH-type transcriptional regulator / antitoxin HipB